MTLPIRHDVQTHMTFGEPHFSASHGMHKFGSRAPVQVDLQLRRPDDSLFKSIGTPFHGQTTLGMFDRRLR